MLEKPQNRTNTPTRKVSVSQSRKSNPSIAPWEPVSLIPSQEDFFLRHNIVNSNNLTTKQAASYLSEILGIPTAPSSLEVYRSKGRGPKYRKVMSRVFYTIQWLKEYGAGIEVKIYDPSVTNGDA